MDEQDNNAAVGEAKETIVVSNNTGLSGISAVSRLADKRQHQRKRVRWRALILLADNEKIPAYVIDVSLGGLRLATASSFTAGGVLSLAIFVPDARKAGQYLVTPILGDIMYQVLSGTEFQIGIRYRQPEQSALDRIFAAMDATPG